MVVRVRDEETRPTRSWVSERARNIPPSGIRKFFDLIATMDDVISLGVGEPDFVTPWCMREAAIYSLERGHTHYTSNYGLIELRELVAEHLFKQYGVRYDPTKEILITVGVSEALDLSMRAIIDPGEEVVVPDPGYVSYAPCVTMAGGRVVPVPTYCQDDFRLQATAVEAAVTPRTKVVLLGYPNNPTGAVMTREGLLEIAEVARKHDLLVISDEIYDRLTYVGEHTCFASLPGMRDRTVLLGGFSKAYAMTGWRLGWAAAAPEIIEAMMKIHQYTIMSAPTMAQAAAIEALKHGEPLVQEMVADYNRRRRVMVKGLNDAGLSCFEPKGAFYAFPDVSVTGLSSEEFAEKLLNEARVVVVPGNAFGACGEGHVRCCYATSLEDIQEALNRIRGFVEKHRANR